VKQLFLSELTGSVYFAEGKPFEGGKPGACIVSGKKTDVTQSFYGVLLQKCPLGGSYLMTDEYGKPCYKVSVEEVE